MTEPVHLVCITYNQINYIDEAINSVLSQDYENLKIIISDDQSIDGTIERIESIIKSYKGPHEIKFIKNEKNQGLIKNLWGALEEVKQGLVVLAAGDDISLPNRVSNLYKHWVEFGKPPAVGSGHFIIDENGTTTNEINFFNDIKKLSILFNIGEEFTLHGATMAFDIDIVNKYPIPQHQYAVEDIILTYRAAMNGNAFYIPEKLVKYRVVKNSMSHVDNKTVYSFTKGKLKLLMARLDSAKTINDDISEHLSSSTPGSAQLNIKKSIEKLELLVDLYKLNIISSTIYAIKSNNLPLYFKSIMNLIKDILWINKNRIYKKL